MRIAFMRILSVLRRKSAWLPQVGLLAERWQLTCPAASPSLSTNLKWPESPAGRKARKDSSKQPRLHHSGGTAPDSHRLPCYAHRGHLRIFENSMPGEGSQ